jgi:hypothetical protein
VISFIYKYKIDQKIVKNFLKMLSFEKIFFFTWRLSDPIESDPVVRIDLEENILTNYKNAKNNVFDKN